jgi:hypothetical protein
MLAVILGNRPPPWVIVLVEQITVNEVEVVNAAIPFQGRAVPMAWVDFEYPSKTIHPASQNTLERYLLTWLAGRAARDTTILIFDRGYPRVELIKDLKEKGFAEPWFLIVAADSKSWLPTKEVAGLYRQRMQIEQCFRDWKSHLGLDWHRAVEWRCSRPSRPKKLSSLFLARGPRSSSPACGGRSGLL